MQIVKLALIGFGTVGTGVARLLKEQRDRLRSLSGAEIAVKWIVVRDPSKRRSLVPDAEFCTDIGRVLRDPEVEIAVEVMGSVQPAREVISALLSAGKHVVTANKAVLAEHGRELFRLAHQKERAVCFEASVAGGIPIVAAVGQAFSGNRTRSLAGILNGTSNFILSAMHDRGLGYREALAQAQAKGFAEADPTLDVDGTDAAQKLAILARLAFHSGVTPAQISKRGINQLSAADITFASELGYVIKLLAVARAEDGKLHLRVAPTLVHKTHPMGQVRGEYNAIEVVDESVGDTFFVGKGAGMMPTASSVVANIVDLVIGRGQATFRSLRLWEDELPGPAVADGSFLSSRFYLRYAIDDRPGTLAQIATILGNQGISIASVIQHETSEDSIGAAVPLIIMTHQADEGAIWNALRQTDALPIIREPTVCLHVAD